MFIEAGNTIGEHPQALSTQRGMHSTPSVQCTLPPHLLCVNACTCVPVCISIRCCPPLPQQHTTAHSISYCNTSADAVHAVLPSCVCAEVHLNCMPLCLFLSFVFCPLHHVCAYAPDSPRLIISIMRRGMNLYSCFVFMWWGTAGAGMCCGLPRSSKATLYFSSPVKWMLTCSFHTPWRNKPDHIC